MFDWERGTTQSLHWEGGNSGHVRYSGDNLHKLIPFSPWRRGCDHWFQLHDFNAHTVLGTDYPKTVRPQGRALRCGVERTVKLYNRVLTKLLIRHRSFEKLEFLQTNHHLMSADAFQTLFNRWDREVTQLMLALEKRCNKFCDRSIEFSPITGIWIRCLQAYRWIQQFHENKVAHGGNLF